MASGAASSHVLFPTHHKPVAIHELNTKFKRLMYGIGHDSILTHLDALGAALPGDILTATDRSSLENHKSLCVLHVYTRVPVRNITARSG